MSETPKKESGPFPSPFRQGRYGDEYAPRPKTLLELRMISISGAIRSKPDWVSKYKNLEIVKKWAREAGADDQMMNYLLKELEWYDEIREGSMELSPVEGVWQADNLIPAELRKKLIDLISPLENVPDEAKDWHPGTDRQVLDLVHPSLFCFVHGLTREVTTPLPVDAIPFIGQGTLISRKTSSKRKRPTRVFSPGERYSDNYSVSEMYQWLPAEFAVDDRGKTTIESYINNLHPKEHAALYPVIAEIFDYFVPMFEKVLTDLRYPRPNRLVADAYKWYDDLKKKINKKNGKKENSYDYYDDEEWEDKVPKQPEIPEFKAPAEQETVSLKGKKLQVIVKLANIVLTPEKPQYAGGSWHVEGMKNESIVASGIYYYVSENISESRLGFRTSVCEPDYEQNDNQGVEAMYGLTNDGPLNQQLGLVETKGGRCIAFPNVLQHRVAPFELQDKTKPGHRKILVFFLVDPTIHVLSTATVPPQQKSWLMGEVSSTEFFKNLGGDVNKEVDKYVDWPMSLEVAKEHREKLMKERKFFVKENCERLFERPFSLCEH
eukprot:TRINITY_DN2223_c0_g1_i3.p1 TRINITY_DN2223_c0_g1~~TRINITY_DN2223_c0_g1_i3.p1  ORF type:complete len:549 (-),score=111.06 TRINITY_DN2223_c0_g1_i3:75-1721(-)